MKRESSEDKGKINNYSFNFTHLSLLIKDKTDPK